MGLSITRDTHTHHPPLPLAPDSTHSLYRRRCPKRRASSRITSFSFTQVFFASPISTHPSIHPSIHTCCHTTYSIPVARSLLVPILPRSRAPSVCVCCSSSALVLRILLFIFSCLSLAINQSSTIRQIGVTYGNVISILQALLLIVRYRTRNCILNNLNQRRLAYMSFHRRRHEGERGIRSLRTAGTFQKMAWLTFCPTAL
ncbi:hypothetical protein FKP32DRAFT_1113190 [Trametes sanguinea]|nr:hypothetical protein FKP32DRAFT_1113190 [Trametes sanguinea]